MKKISFFIILVILGLTKIQAQSCTVNSGGDFSVCGNSTSLTGTVSSNATGSPTWTLQSFTVAPGGGTPTVSIASPNSLTTSVSGLTVSGTYTFRLTHPCTSGTAIDDVVVTVYANTGFTAGPDVSAGCVTSNSSVNLTGAVIPPGFTGVWTIENTFKRARYSNAINLNSSLSSNTVANPTFSLTNATNHTEDPTYTLTLTITGGSCSYSDSRIVAFDPNPSINVNNESKCTGLTGSEFTIIPSAPFWATSRTGFTSSGSLTLNVISQPSGASMTLQSMETDQNTAGSRIFFSGMTALGTYTYTITATSACGTVSTSNRTYTLTGQNPGDIDLTPPGNPTQEENWLGSGAVRAGELHCNSKAGTTASECFYFDINPNDSTTLPISITNTPFSSVLPPGASTPTFTITRGVQGEPRRVEVCVNPGSSGWQVGTYVFGITTGSSPCTRITAYAIHISDNGRVAMNVPDVTVCYPGTGTVGATVTLPTRFVTTTSNPSYFQYFSTSTSYAITNLSRPSGAAVPTLPAQSDREITDASTTITNLNTPGQYRFIISIFNGNSSANFINQDYACAGVKDRDTFSIFVESLQTANAGSNQTFACSNISSLVGNAPSGTNTGLWQLVSKPSGAADPVIVSSTSPNTNLTGINTVGTYTFSWRIATASGSCVSTDNVDITISSLAPIISSISSTDIVNANDGTITVNTAATGSITYTITRGSFTASLTNSAGSATFTGLAPGVYDVSITNGTCPSDVLKREIFENVLQPDINVTYVNTPTTGNISTNDVTLTSTTYNTSPTLTSGPSGTGVITSLTMNSNGTYSFQSNTPGVYVYTVSVCRLSNTPPNCPTETLTITVLDNIAVPQPPIANPDIAITQLNTAVILRTLTNDKAATSFSSLNAGSVTVLNPLTGTGTSGTVANGSFSVNTSTGDITFTPNTGFVGTVTYSYQVCDNSSTPLCATSFQEITVLPAGSVNTTLAVDDYAFVSNTNTSGVSGNVLTNDIDAEGNTMTVTAQTVTVSGKGTLTLNTNGSYTFVPVSTYHGPVNFPYTMCDNGTPQACANATLYILVEDVTVLPVSFISLNAECATDKVIVKWQTAQETNNSHFEVQKNRNSEWIKIGAVKGAGTSYGVKSYQFNDPIQGEVLHLYRIKQVDFDGHSEISQPIVAICSETNAMGNQINLYPNPVTNVLNIVSESESIGNVEVMDINGKRLIVTSIDKASTELDLSHLAPGMYFIKVNEKVFKLVKE